MDFSSLTGVSMINFEKTQMFFVLLMNFVLNQIREQSLHWLKILISVFLPKMNNQNGKIVF